MPTKEAALQFEGQAPARTIRLVQTGEFYKAYNRSAFYFHTCIRKYKVLHSVLKSSGDEVLCVGFPVKKIMELLDGRKVEETKLGIDIQLKEDDITDNENDYEEWKKSVPTNKESFSDVAAVLSGCELVLAEIGQKIVSFPIENKTPIEAMMFLSEVKRMILAAQGRKGNP